MLVAVLLAAGGGSRFRGDAHKLLAPLGGVAVYRRALAAMTEAAIGPNLVVTGAVALDLPPDVREVHNADWAAGQASSVHAGVAAAADLGADAVVIGLADQPFVTAAAWRAVASQHPTLPIVVASYDGRRGPNPVRLHRSVWPELPTTGDEGARRLLQAHPSWVGEVECVGSAADIDTVEDLSRWTNC